MKKQMVSILLAGCTVVALSGYGGNVVKAEESNVVSIMGWYDEDDMQGVIDAVNEYMGEEFTLEYTYVSLADFNNVLGTQLASGEGPDIIMDGAQFPARVKAGNLVDITEKEFIADFTKEGLSLSTQDDKVYGIPTYGWFSGIWYNSDILSECGIEVPKTMDEFIAACEKIEEAGYQPMGFGLADGDTGWASLVGYLENSFYHNNSDNPDGISFDALFASGEKTMEGNYNATVQEWYTLIEKGYINPEMLGISNQDALNTFKQGTVAFFNGGPWQYNEIKESGIGFGLMPQLSKTGNEPFTGGGPAANIGINVNAQNKEGAEKALEAFASVEVQQEFVNANPGSPSYRSGVQSEIPEEYAAIKDTVDAGRISVNWDRWSVNMPAETMNNEAIAQVQGLVSGDLSVDDFVLALDMKADSSRYE